MQRLALFLVAVLCLVLPAGRAPAAEPGDPLERVNRGVFWFNDKLDVYVMEPVARGWNRLVPRCAQRGVANFFANLRLPVVAANDLLQGKLTACGSDLGRFAVNTTVGVIGFMDPAQRWGLVKREEDFGQTLGVWRVPPGPYLVLPLLGPSTLRDSAGLLADSAAAVYPWFVPIVYSLAPKAVETVNFRAQVLDDVREAKRAALDYYTFTRDAYTQRRRRQVADREEMGSEEQEELYYLDEE